jgi:tetratricopeptide (TPR) repeat protein
MIGGPITTAQPTFVPPSMIPLSSSVELMQEGVDLLDHGKNREAAEHFARVRELTPHYALAAYFQAMALQQEGDFDRARSLYLIARDEDDRPVRVLGSFNQEVRRLGAEGRGVHLVDLEQTFLDASEATLVGMDLFYDYVHPNAAGHALAARAILSTVMRLLPQPVHGNAPEPVVAEGCPPAGNQTQAAVLLALSMAYDNNGRPD